MSELSIRVQNLSKQYRLGEIGTGTIKQDFNRLWYKIRGKEDPYLKIGEINDRSVKKSSNYVWALKDINFEVDSGIRKSLFTNTATTPRRKNSRVGLVIFEIRISVFISFRR